MPTMAVDSRKVRKEEREREREREKLLRKDRLIQTRVDRRLQKVLVDQARSRRISVSNLVRNILEDAFGLAAPEVAVEVEPIVAPECPPEPEPESPPEPAPDLDHVYAWNAVILGRDAQCSRCRSALEAGGRGFIGLSEDPTAPRAWLCPNCGEAL